LRELCEIRVPTYRRPQLLKRALLSIVMQTHNDWSCIVFDDCPDGSARSVTEEIDDPRIAYLHNSPPLGAAMNIDQSFKSRPIRGGRYAFVLEDDNYLFSRHIEAAINVLKKHDVRVALCNQFCEEVELPGQPGRLTAIKTLNWMYDEGLFHPNELLPALLFSQGFSNGAAFWRTDCLSDFQIGQSTMRPGIQESMRLLRLRDPVYVSLEPTAVWRSNDPRESYVNAHYRVFGLWHFIRRRFDQIREGKEKLRYRSDAMGRVALGDVLDYARSHKHAAQIERALLLCGYKVAVTKRRNPERLCLLVMGYAARHILPANRQPASVANQPFSPTND
jgi:glycosyltransferase involved in cell wall biosynthesis